MTSTFGFSTSDQIPISQQIPGYRLRRHVGTDAIGLWFDAEQESLGRKITLKTLKPDYEEHAGAHKEFLAEMDRLAALDHPNLLRVIDTRREKPLALVTERMTAATVAALLEGGKPVGREDALRPLIETARGLAYLHEQGLNHKNLHPGLLSKSDGGVVRIATFRNIVSHEELAAIRGKLVQDPRYVAPEQLGGDHAIGPKVSTYQLGAMLYHLLAAMPPHEGADAKETALLHFREEFPSLKKKQPFLPAPLLDLVQEATQRDPEARPTVSEMADRMEEILEGKADSGKGTAPRSRRRRRRRY
ncbi:MAG: protein kinase [Planctomycetota bacterium]